MAICIESYRARIGTYVPNKSKTKKFYQNVNKKRKSTKQSSIHLWLALISIIIIPYLGLKWPYPSFKGNLEHYIYGNKRNCGYKYFSWNCDRGFISKHKIEDVRIFAEKHKPHFIAISEIDLRRNELNKNEENNNELSSAQIKDKFRLEGYQIFLPNSWEAHGKARIMVYVKDEVKVRQENLRNDEKHIQTVLLEVGFGRSRSHLASFYYREWKSCVMGESSKEFQCTYLSQLMDVWRRCTDRNKEFVALGDMNLCSKQMDDPSYIHGSLSEIVTSFNLEEGCHQLVDNYNDTC